MTGFVKTSQRLPQENIAVETMCSQGHIQTLKRKGNMWWFPDESMYVYYIPMYWRYI